MLYTPSSNLSLWGLCSICPLDLSVGWVISISELKCFIRTWGVPLPLATLTSTCPPPTKPKSGVILDSYFPHSTHPIHQHVLWALCSKYTLNMTTSHNLHHFIQPHAIPFLAGVLWQLFYHPASLFVLLESFFYPEARVIISKCKLDHITPLLKVSNGFPSLSESNPIFLPYLQSSAYLFISLLLLSASLLYSYTKFLAAFQAYQVLSCLNTFFLAVPFTYTLPLDLHIACSVTSFTFLHIIFSQWLSMDQSITLYFLTISLSFFQYLSLTSSIPQ